MNKQKKILIVVSIISVVLAVTMGVLGAVLLSKENKEGEPTTNKPANNQSVEITATGDFEIDLFRESFVASQSNGGFNTVISPLSIKMAMAMVTEGAKEETLTELREVLELDENSKTYYQNLIDDISGQDDVTLAIANSLWSREGLEFKQDFVDLLGDYYYAEATSLDFNDSSSVDTINSWVKDNTDGKIDKILEEIDPLEIMYLINAIYFNADWTEQFNEDHTQEKDFTLIDGSIIQTDLMSMDSDFLYQENDDFQAVELPYGENGRYVMRVYLPNEGKEIDEFVSSDMTREKLNKWKEGFSLMEGYLELPKFKIEYSSSLEDVLKNLGIRKAFDSGSANFKGIIDQNAYISKVFHKTYIDVGEKGTEAAAVTMIGMSLMSMPTEQKETFKMIVDRPFFFTIDDTQNDEILFMGTILNPTK
ncbi:MAG: Proteinase inhibitor I4 serpin [candidate division WS6 bacterium 34_10]|uniref:Proteinase inhibitor I4 serpin n=1 Tax=candidate division WS6 bacterium 34_10 TaxID=1641389 RepID=A0A101HH55_9BACT|nr:MAG: Proteinase inhibitor I4 serpin [candidate division WS6 bacterium 34_10]